MNVRRRSRRSATLPVTRADTPTRRHADTPTRRHADTPTRRYADTPIRRYVDTSPPPSPGQTTLKVDLICHGRQSRFKNLDLNSFFIYSSAQIESGAPWERVTLLGKI